MKARSTEDAIKTFRKRLTALPRKEPEVLTGKDLVTRIAPEILEMRSRGYAMQQIADWIAEDFGVALRPDTVSSYLRGTSASAD